LSAALPIKKKFFDRTWIHSSFAWITEEERSKTISSSRDLRRDRFFIFEITIDAVGIECDRVSQATNPLGEARAFCGYLN
jgi:hypothetical protein